MNRYYIKAVSKTFLITEIIAENEQAAWDIAKNMDGGDFTPLEHTGDFYIYDVDLIEENAEA